MTGGAHAGLGVVGRLERDAWGACLAVADSAGEDGAEFELAAATGQHADEIAGDARALAVAWGLQGIGWLFIELAPAVIRVGLGGAAQARVARMRHARGRIEDQQRRRERCLQVSKSFGAFFKKRKRIF